MYICRSNEDIYLFLLQLAAVTDELESRQQQLTAAKEAAHRASMEQYQDMEHRQRDMADRDETIAQLQADFNQLQIENEVKQEIYLNQTVINIKLKLHCMWLRFDIKQSQLT